MDTKIPNSPDAQDVTPAASVPAKSWLRRYWWMGLVAAVVVLLAAWAVMAFIVHPKESSNVPGGSSGFSDKGDKDNQKPVGKSRYVTGQYPKCPAKLSGVLTHQLMDPKYIGGMLPLGNVNPPGHTSPVDHIYFVVNTSDRIPLYVPADSSIIHVMANSVKDANGNYNFDSYVVTYMVCDGLVLDFAGYNDVSDSLKAELAKHKDACKYGIVKVGHDNSGEGQCDYNDLSFKVKSGEPMGWTQRAARAGGGYTIPFEIWAANYNVPARSDVNWDTYYGDDRYAHSICTFDLYSGSLKDQFDARFGLWDEKSGLARRTVAPVCGTVNQDIVGALQGMWFSGKLNTNDKSGNVGATGAGIAFLHNNTDPTKGEVSIGGELENHSVTGIVTFTPVHSGTTNREPSEVKADGQVYCYQGNAAEMGSNQPVTGKILVQLVDAHHIRAEHRAGTCGGAEAFGPAYNFER